MAQYLANIGWTPRVRSVIWGSKHNDLEIKCIVGDTVGCNNVHVSFMYSYKGDHTQTLNHYGMHNLSDIAHVRDIQPMFV